MNRWILTHARLAFWLWTVPSLALLVWCPLGSGGVLGDQRIPVRLGQAAGIPGDGRVL